MWVTIAVGAILCVFLLSALIITAIIAATLLLGMNGGRAVEILFKSAFIGVVVSVMSGWGFLIVGTIMFFSQNL